MFIFLLDEWKVHSHAIIPSSRLRMGGGGSLCTSPLFIILKKPSEPSIAILVDSLQLHLNG